MSGGKEAGVTALKLSSVGVIVSSVGGCRNLPKHGVPVLIGGKVASFQSSYG